MNQESSNQQIPLSGSGLDPFKIPPDGSCWWCGKQANTREHKFKRSDINRMWTSGESLLWGTDAHETRNIRSPRKSTFLKFTANLCATCNNTRSQPFDMAYDTYIEYIWNRLEELWDHDTIDMKGVYGEAWQKQVMNLAKYFIKHLACRISHDGFRVPESLPAFLNDDDSRPPVSMVTFKHPGLWRAMKGTRGDSPKGSAGLFMTPAHGHVNIRAKHLETYSYDLIVGYIGMMIRWSSSGDQGEPFYLFRQSILHHRDSLPDF